MTSTTKFKDQCDGQDYPDNSYRERPNFLYTRINEDAKLHQCILCNFKTNCQRSLKRHHMIHTNERPYNCLNCCYRARSKCNLEQHVLYGCGSKKICSGVFQCELCDYSTSRKQSLQRHKLCHTGERPFNCDVCNYRARRKDALMEHKLLHTTREKQFTCNFCDFKTFFKRSLIRHLRRH